jgi:hypothetical protein
MGLVDLAACNVAVDRENQSGAGIAPGHTARRWWHQGWTPLSLTPSPHRRCYV